MDIIDYSLSFLAGKWADNNVRFWIESRTRIIDERAAAAGAPRSQDYYQCASCKSEDTFALKDLFYEDNYDFLPVFGPEWGVIFRRKSRLNSDYKSVLPSSKMWEGQDYHVVQPTKFRELTSNAEVRQATADWLPIVAQTEVWNEATGLRAIMEYPVKTMNIHHGRDLYQTDTGPLAFPDLSRRHERWADALSLAFCAFNAPHFADFVIEAPTRVTENGKELATIHHYSQRVSLSAKNRLYAIEALPPLRPGAGYARL